MLRSESPDMVRQEIWGYLLTHYALSALICTAATNAGIDPDLCVAAEMSPLGPAGSALAGRRALSPRQPGSV
jgi:hypothetical protein